MSVVLEREPETTETPVDMPPIFGKCPVCKKHLHPACKITGKPKAPAVNAGKESRAKCDRCGSIIVYIGNGEWRVATQADVEEDKERGDV